MMNSDNIKLADIAYEQIVDIFWYGSYGVFRVVIMKDCGFINATRLCADGGKELKLWTRNASSSDLLQCLATKLGYYHPHIIPHIASWVSAEYALHVSE